MARAPSPPTWTVEERSWEPARNAAWETVFTLANGYLGIRGFPEEGFDAGPTTPGIYVAGVFNPGADGIPELVNVTNFLAVEIVLGGSPFRLAEGRVQEYRRQLDMRRGLLRRSLVYTEGGRSTRLEFERFASVVDPHVVGQSVTVVPLDWTGEVSLTFWMDARVRNSDKAHLRLVHSGHMSRDCMLLATETDTTLVRIGHACRCRGWVHHSPPPKPAHVGVGEKVGLRYCVELECGQRAVFDRTVATYTSRDRETTSVERCCLEAVRGKEGAAYGVKRRGHVRGWARRWANADIEIEGPEDDQRAVRFAAFHLIQSASSTDPTVSIAAKGLSGEGYRGHVFWDTEIFMLPFFIWTAPATARRLLQYRCHTLQGARKKAAACGYKGAMFAWESTDTGEETCPPYVFGPDGSKARVLTGELEHHISADVVYGAWQYVCATGDEVFRGREFLTLAVETARFWESRVTWNDRERRFEIHGVIGADEFHEDVNNNAFTNYMAAWNLRLASEEALRALSAPGNPTVRRLGLTEAEAKRWREVAAGLFIPRREDGLWEQHDGFFQLPDPMPQGAPVGDARRAQVLKQPDVLMLAALFPEAFPPEAKRRNWDYYEPRTLHGSSLSPSIHSIVASDLGLAEEAYAYFRRSAFIDLGDLMGNTSAGLHCAALGGTWQAVVRGFLGLRPDAERLDVRPRLPKTWRKVSTRIQHRRRWFKVEATHEGARIAPIVPADPPG